MANESPVLSAREGAVLTLTLNRPSRLNALDHALLDALLKELRAAARDGGVRAVVLTGAGRAFCAGGDLKALEEAKVPRPGDAFYSLASMFHLCVQEVRWMEKPVIAAVNGVAAGGGFSLALACDLRVMASSATMHQAYTTAGLVFDGGSSWTLPRLVGLARSLELAMLDEPVSAEKAARVGLVSQVVADEQVVSTAKALAARAAGRAVGAFARAKKLLNGSFEQGLDAQLEAERHAISAAADSAEGREGIGAFLGKREPKFPGA